ncbi:CAP-Gly domain-containing linker protein 1-like [Topomyia yanbarensis]|uniref:CAP-Gly domain-containing linker protein 1-like n=1 Tax=Topomyia yanbarensis TaxID=2498891 RepID=UPI00273C36B0|nr:CAP-Gly domain-containing linker protein 1-like [Topomyia yanbarensis]
MSNDGGHNGKKRPTSASPYSENFKVPMDLCQKHLINHRLVVSKLSRKELEDKYINLCDETFTVKKRNQEQELVIKKLKTKLLRLSSESSKHRSKGDISSNHSNIQSLETQRRELHDKLEALRRSDGKSSREKREDYNQRYRSARRPKEEQPTTTAASVSNDNGNERYFGANRSTVDSSSEDDRTSSRSSDHKGPKSCRNCEKLKEEKIANEAEYVKMKIDMKFLNKEIQNEKEKAALIERQLEEKLSYEIMRQNAEENMEMINLTRQLNDMQRKMQNQQEAEKRALDAELAKQTELEQKIRSEKDKNTHLFDECERLKKNIEKLREHMSEVEIERDYLKRQQESYTKIVDENKLLRYQLEELRRKNEELAIQIQTLQEEEAVAKNAQKTLLEKLKSLQLDNDALSIMLEGLRTENEVLAEEKTLLEKNLNRLEDSPVKDDGSSPLQRIEIGIQTQLVKNEEHVQTQTQLDDNNENVVSPVSQIPIRHLTKAHIKETTESPPKIRENESDWDHRRMSVKRVGINIREKTQLLEQNARSSEPSCGNAALLVSNATSMIATKLREKFKSYDIQSNPYTPARPSLISTASITSSDRRRISFQRAEYAATENASGTSDLTEPPNGNEMRKNYAGLFGHSPEMQQRIRAYSKVMEQKHSEQIAIEILTIRWEKKALDKLFTLNVRDIYVELVGFLDMRGYQVETKLVSISTNESLELAFNYSFVVDLDEKKHPKRRELLRKMLQPSEDDTLKFIVVHEKQTDCAEIGYAKVKLRHEIQEPKVENIKTIDAPIFSITDPGEEIGTLQIVVKGISLLKMKFWA